METIDKTVGQIVRDDYRAADVFEKFGIDFCCAGKKPLEASCREKGVEVTKVIKELEEATGNNAPDIDYNSLSLTALIEHITETHHRYAEETGPVIIKYLEKVNMVHGKHNPELNEILTLFKAIVADLAVHMKKEELILFPYIKRLEQGRLNEGSYKPSFASIQQPINMMMGDHETEGERYKRIEELANFYAPPSHACNTFRVSYAKLEEFEKDLHLHIHLENNILFPKAIEMEKQWESVASSKS